MHESDIQGAVGFGGMFRPIDISATTSQYERASCDFENRIAFTSGYGPRLKDLAQSYPVNAYSFETIVCKRPSHAN